MSALAKKVEPELKPRLPDPSLFRGDHPWYVVIAHPGAEALVERELTGKGYEAWLPLCLIEKPRAEHKPIRELRPLFTHYLFVGVDRANGMEVTPIFSVRGVADMIRGEARFPTAIPEAALIDLHTRLTPGNGAMDFTPQPRRESLFKPGDKLRINDGPFAGLEGLCGDTNGEEVRILLGIMGRQVGVWIEDAAVERTIAGIPNSKTHTAY